MRGGRGGAGRGWVQQGKDRRCAAVEDRPGWECPGAEMLRGRGGAGRG